MKRTALKRSQKPIPKKREKKRTSKGLFTSLKKKSKTEEWSEVRKELEISFAEQGIPKYCELRLEGCKGTFGIAFAHSKKRTLIAKEQPERSRELREVVWACVHCHYLIEYPKKSVTEPLGETGHEYMYRMVREIISNRN